MEEGGCGATSLSHKTGNCSISEGPIASSIQPLHSAERSLKLLSLPRRDQTSCRLPTSRPSPRFRIVCQHIPGQRSQGQSDVNWDGTLKKSLHASSKNQL